MLGLLCAGPVLVPVQAEDLETAEIVYLLDGESGDAEAARILGERGVKPLALAGMLRSWKPANPLQFRGVEKVPLRGEDGRETDLWVYLPKTCRGVKPWPCMVALHGRGGNGRQMIELLRKSADRYGYLVVAPSARKFPEMLPLHPHWWKYTPDGFPIAALQWAKRNLVVDDDRVLLIGYSMGGYGAWNVGLGFPDRFFAVAPFAGGISQLEYLGGKDRKRRCLLTNAAMVRLYFAHGDADRIVTVRSDRECHETLKKLGIPHTYREIKGGRHILTEVIAAGRGNFEKGYLIAELFDSLKSKSRPGLSSPFSFTALSAPVRVRFLAIEQADAPPIRVRAEVEDGGFRLEAEGVRRFTVYFDGLLHDLSSLVSVRINGKEVFRGKPEPSLRTVVTSWRALRDRKRVFVAEISAEVPEEEEEGF